jgi:hypothetical protein
MSSLLRQTLQKPDVKNGIKVWSSAVKFQLPIIAKLVSIIQVAKRKKISEVTTKLTFDVN